MHVEKSNTLVKAVWSTKPAGHLVGARGFAVTQAHVVSYEVVVVVAAAAAAAAAAA